jgi:hypothetical protein
VPLRPQPKKRRRGSLGELPEGTEVGPASVAVVVGRPQGRWRDALASKYGERLRVMLEARSEVGPYDYGEAVSRWAGLQPDAAYVLGVLAMPLWRSPELRDSVSSTAAIAMQEALCSGHGKSSTLAFLDLPVLGGFRCVEPVPLEPGLVDMLTRSPGAFWGALPLAARQATVVQRDGGAADVVGLSAAAEQLCETHGVPHVFRVPYPWAVYGPVAECLSRGLLELDMLCLGLRDKSAIRLRPGHPAPQIAKTFVEILGRPMRDVAAIAAARPAAAQEAQGPRAWHGNRVIRRYDVGHMLRALLAAKDLRSQRGLVSVLSATLTLAFPEQAEEMLSELAARGFQAPSNSTLLRARWRFDAAAMLWQRRLNRKPRRVFRYLAVDASPQGLEVLVCRELAVEGGLLEGPVASWRLLPVATLAAGHFGAWQKHLALTHMVFLEGGPRREDMLKYFSEVRAVVSDMGTEMCLSNHPCATDMHLSNLRGQHDDLRQHLKADKFAFPLAITVPGMNHIADNLLKAAITRRVAGASWGRAGCGRCLRVAVCIIFGTRTC